MLVHLSIMASRFILTAGVFAEFRVTESWYRFRLAVGSLIQSFRPTLTRLIRDTLKSPLFVFLYGLALHCILSSVSITLSSSLICPCHLGVIWDKLRCKSVSESTVLCS